MIDVQHRDGFDSLVAMRDAGGADLILTSPPYPDARSVEQYGGARFDTSIDGYHRLGVAVFDALKIGGVCVIVIDGPVRVWRPELGESERSMIAFEVALDWAKKVGFRYLEHNAYGRDGTPTSGDGCNPRHRSGWEPCHVFARPGAQPHFDRHAYTLPARYAGARHGARNRTSTGWRKGKGGVQGDSRCLRSMERWQVNAATTDREHPAPFSSDFADAMVLCYAHPGALVGDPFVGCGTVALSCRYHGRRFIGGDLGHRQRDGRRWADIVNDKTAQRGLFDDIVVYDTHSSTEPP